MDNNAWHWASSKKSPESFLSFEYCKKLHASKVLPQFHTPSDTVCSRLEACHWGERMLVLTSLIWLNECFAPCGECTFLLKIIMGCVTDRDPVTFFIPFHFGHRAGSFVRASDRWARTKPHSHNPTLPITQSSVASLSQADDGPDETGSKQTESWKRGKPFPLHYKGTQHAGVLLLWKWWHSKKVNVNRTWLIGLFDRLNLFFFYAFIFSLLLQFKMQYAIHSQVDFLMNIKTVALKNVALNSKRNKKNC